MPAEPAAPAKTPAPASGWAAVVVHADLDAFYAAVEQLDNPGLRGKAVLVGPDSRRGVVLTASYEARPWGVGSAMPMARARRLCPHAIVVEPRFGRYQELSARVMDVFADFSPRVEALSLDEAFLEMSGCEHLFGPPATMAAALKQAVFAATGLHVSVGVAATKHIAKVASGQAKPDGAMVVAPAVAKAWLAPLPVSRLWGVGGKTAPRLAALGLRTVGDVAAADPRRLAARLGSAGSRLHQLANAVDPRPVQRIRAAGSMGSERTLAVDVRRREDIERHLRRAAERIARRLRAKGWTAGGVRLRLKTSRFALLARQRRLPRAADTAAELLAAARALLDEVDQPGPFRLVGMAVYDLAAEAAPRQLDLFANGARRRLEATIDALAERFGAGAVVRARDLRHQGTVMAGGVNLDFLDPGHPG